jgi:hypothetical protein
MKICLIQSAGRDYRAAAERGKPHAMIDELLIFIM